MPNNAMCYVYTYVHSKLVKILVETILTKFRLMASFGTAEKTESGRNIHGPPVVPDILL